MIKKILILFKILLLLSFSSCGNNRNKETNEATEIKITRDVIKSRKADTSLKVIDGDTVEDIITGQIFVLKNVDTPETIAGTEKAKKVGLDTSIKGTPLLQQSIDNGSITAKDLYKHSISEDMYGRNFVSFPSLEYEIIRRGEGVPTNKFNTKGQELYRAYQQKQYELYGEIDNGLKRLREYNLDKYSATNGFIDRIGNLVDAFQSRTVRLGAELGDTVLDILKYGIATVTNSDLLDEWKKADVTDREFGYDNRESLYNMDEIEHQFLIDNYSKVVAYLLINSPELIVENLPNIIALVLLWLCLLKLKYRIMNRHFL